MKRSKCKLFRYTNGNNHLLFTFWFKQIWVCKRTFLSLSRAHLQSFLEDILKRLHDLLILNTPDNGSRLVQLSNEDQLFVYETAGILIVQSQFEPEVRRSMVRCLIKHIYNIELSTQEINDTHVFFLFFFFQKKLELMRQLLAPIVSKYDSLLQAMIAANHEPTQQAYAECLTNAMSFAR